MFHHKWKATSIYVCITFKGLLCTNAATTNPTKLMKVADTKKSVQSCYRHQGSLRWTYFMWLVQVWAAVSSCEEVYIICWQWFMKEALPAGPVLTFREELQLLRQRLFITQTTPQWQQDRTETLPPVLHTDTQQRRYITVMSLHNIAGFTQALIDHWSVIPVIKDFRTF